MKKRWIGLLLTLCMVLPLLPLSALAAGEKAEIADGWYYLRCMNNYLNLTADGGGELRRLASNEAFYVEGKGEGKFTLRLKDGRYLGLEGARKDGLRVRAVNSPYTWSIYAETTNFGQDKRDIFSLRPPEVSSMVVNASGQKNADGTHVIVWTHHAQNFDAPNHAELRFIPVTTTNDSTGESWTVYQEDGLVGYRDALGNVVISAQFARAKPFSQGIALVRPQDSDLSGYINTAGEFITPAKYAGELCDSTVRDGRVRVGVYGDEITSALLSGARIDHFLSEGGRTVVILEDSREFNYSHKQGFIDSQGEEVIDMQFDSAISFSDGLAAVFQTQFVADGGVEFSKVGWIDTNGKLVIPYMSSDASNYDGTVHCFKEGLACYFVETDTDHITLPLAGIINKEGQIIIPAQDDEWFPSSSFGLQWRDGVIAVSADKEANSQGVATIGGGYEWTFSALYDYSGTLIRNLDGYVWALPIGGGYTLALHQLPEGPLVDVLGIQMPEGYWSVFDRKGRMVVEKAEENNFYLVGSPIGYDNGYIYFGDSRYEVSQLPVR